MVEFKTKLDDGTLGKLTDLQIDKNNKFIKGLRIFFLVMGVLLLIIAYDEYKNAESYYFSLFTAVFSFAFGIIFPSMVVKATRRNQNIQNKSNSTLSGDAEMLFKFDEERMFIFVNRGEKFRSAIDTDYDYIFKVYEDNETYILYISKMECYIINKSDLISGTLEEFNKIISSHVPADKIERKIQ